MLTGSVRTSVWIALTVQFLGYAFDALWHGLLFPGAEPRTRDEMVRHLVIVHLPLYLGVVGTLLATARAAVSRQERFTVGPRRVALGGATLSAVGEGWHAISHLRMDTHAAPMAGILSVVGFVVVVTAIAVESRGARTAAAGHPHQRRAA